MENEKNLQSSDAENNELENGLVYDVFSENGKAEEKNINRNYLNFMYKDGLAFQHETVTFSRTMYNKMYLDIEKHYHTQRKELAKWMFICQIIAALFILSAITLAKQTGIFLTYAYGIAGIINFILMIISILIAISMGVFTIGLYIKYLKLEKEFKYNIERLNQRRDEAKMLGTYDAQ